MRPKIYRADEHEIDPSFIDADALTVLTKLHQAGFIAYLVGGGVRDLLVKKRPKDFDISTSASPEEIKRLFTRSCVLIGRRFRLAHIRFGRKIIEVSTFRSGESGDELIVRDNQWGNPEEDALRRDFTINGLFLDPAHHQVIDFVGGWDDIHRGVLRTIGDPIIRFKQDPVRMIRLVKFAARFGFCIDPDTNAAMTQCKREIVKSSPARVLEELLRMLESGASQSFFRLMLNCGLLELLLPWLAHFLKTRAGEKIYELLGIADEVIKREGVPLPRPILSACLLFPILDKELHTHYIDKGVMPNLGDISMVTHMLVRGVAEHSFPQFPKRLKMEWGFILGMQYRLAPANQKIQPRSKLLRHMDFPLALSLLKLRATQHAELVPFLNEWTLLYEKQLQLGSPEDASAEISEPHRVRHKPRYRNRSHSPPRPPHAH